MALAEHAVHRHGELVLDLGILSLHIAHPGLHFRLLHVRLHGLLGGRIAEIRPAGTARSTAGVRAIVTLIGKGRPHHVEHGPTVLALDLTALAEQLADLLDLVLLEVQLLDHLRLQQGADTLGLELDLLEAPVLSAIEDRGQRLLNALVEGHMGLAHRGEALGHLGIRPAGVALPRSASGILDTVPAIPAEAAVPAEATEATEATVPAIPAEAAVPAIPAEAAVPAVAAVLAAGSASTSRLVIGVAIVATTPAITSLAPALTRLSLWIHLIAELAPALIGRLDEGPDLRLLGVFEL